MNNSYSPITPHYYQENAIQSIFDYFDRASGNPIVAMPTGTGKSVVIGGFVHRVLNRWPNQRFMMATHVKELVKQNTDRIKDMWPGAPIGIYSAGLGVKDYMQPIIYGGVGSMVNAPQLFGHRDLLLIDECHLVGKNDEAQYQGLIHGLKQVNPYLKVIGYTATPYRMGMGMLTNGNIFTDICFDNTRLEDFNELIARGYIAMLITQKTSVEVDVRSIGTNSTNGDFIQSQMEERVTRITEAAIQETIKYAGTRHSWLVFAGGVGNAERVAARYRELGAKAIAIHGGTKEFPLSPKERDERIEAFKAGYYQIAVNYNVLTTGFDHKPIDLIVMLRATKSVPLWVQMLGRGTRTFFGDNYFPPKRNCLVLDFAGNTSRLGPINDPVIPRKKGEGGGEAPIKICEECGTYNHISVRYCVGCGAEFDFQEKVVSVASDLEVIRDIIPQYEELIVEQVFYRRHHSKRSGLDSFCAMHYCKGNRVIEEWVTIEGKGRARDRAVQWWSQRSSMWCPATIEEALKSVANLSVPSRIVIQSNADFPHVERCFFD